MPPTDAAIRLAFSMCRPGSSRGAELKRPTTKKQIFQRGKRNCSHTFVGFKRNKTKQVSVLFFNQCQVSLNPQTYLRKPLISCLSICLIHKSASNPLPTTAIQSLACPSHGKLPELLMCSSWLVGLKRKLESADTYTETPGFKRGSLAFSRWKEQSAAGQTTWCVFIEICV